MCVKYINCYLSVRTIEIGFVGMLTKDKTASAILLKLMPEVSSPQAASPDKVVAPRMAANHKFLFFIIVTV